MLGITVTVKELWFIYGLVLRNSRTQLASNDGYMYSIVLYTSALLSVKHY